MLSLLDCKTAQSGDRVKGGRSKLPPKNRTFYAVGYWMVYNKLDRKIRAKRSSVYEKSGV